MDDLGLLLSQVITDDELESSLHGIHPNLVLPNMDASYEMDIFPENEDDPLDLADEGFLSMLEDTAMNITPRSDSLATPSNSDVENPNPRSSVESRDFVPVQEQVELFNGDSLLPIYRRSNKTLGTRMVAEEIVNGINPSLIAKLVPHQPKDTLFPPIHVHALIYETGAVVHAPKVSPKFPFSSFIKMPLESRKAGSKFPYFPYFCRKNRKNGENSLLLPYFGP